MERMVYSPRAYVFTKDRNNVIRDVSDYVTAGRVERVVNAVSSAEITLRNPDMVFTTPNPNGLVTFMPMDPITIYLERLKGYPVRVFTGFLDTTPYLQLYPGTIGLKASCTLKRLQYTFFDPGLPYTQSFFSNFGWTNVDGAMFSLNGLNDWQKEKDGVKSFSGDGSLAELLAATLIYIGNWDDKSIYIEPLPHDIFDRLAALQAQISDSNKAVLDEFNALLKKIIGAGSHGSPDGSDSAGGGGDMSTGSVKGEKKIIQTIIKAANKWTVPAEYAIATCQMESGFKSDPGSGNGIVQGWYQWDKVNGPPGSYAGAGCTRSKPNGCYDLGFASDLFCEALHRNKKRNPDMDWRNLVMKTQGVNCDNNPAYCDSRWDNAFKNAKSLKAKYGIGSNVPGLGEAQAASVTTTTTRASSSSSKSAAKGSWKIQSGVPTNITQPMKDYLDAMSGFYNGALIVTTTTNHSYLTDSGNKSDHVDGNACDFGSVANWGGQIDGAGGFKIAIAAYRAAGLSYNEAVKQANIPQYDRWMKGKKDPNGAQILWRVAGHHDHVHVGVHAGTKPSGGGANIEIKISFDYTNMLPDKRARKDKPKIIVLHDTESHNVPGTSDLKQLGQILKNQGLSVHVGIDAEGNIARYVKDMDVAFHVSNYNEVALGIEQIGMATQTVWPKDQIKQAATMVAYWANKYNIPLTRSTDHGVCTHKDLGASGGGHVDPGPAYPFDDVLSQAKDMVDNISASESGTGGGAQDTSGDADTSAANAFAVTFNFPSIEEGIESIALTGNKSLMNDQPLLPFIQQLAESSLRSFQSLPDGRFYAFYPDYFGEMLHHQPYWEIDDLEVLAGGIELSDDALVTHMYVIGDTTWPSSEGLINKLTTSGVVTIFDAFLTGQLATSETPAEADSKAAVKTADKKDDKDAPPAGMGFLLTKDEAAQFLERFGARPSVESMTMIKSHFFEFFVAYQRFLLAWSRQFITTFQFTFMPELYPGGKVGFRDHGLQMYIEDVTHVWDYESGFTTTANLSAPSVYMNNPKSLPPNMVRAILASDSDTSTTDSTGSTTTTNRPAPNGPAVPEQ
jgi:hypothetical protein